MNHSVQNPYSPRLPAEKRLEQADPDRASFPLTQPRLSAAPTEGALQKGTCGVLALGTLPGTPPSWDPGTATPPPPPKKPCWDLSSDTFFGTSECLGTLLEILGSFLGTPFCEAFARNPLSSFPVRGPARLPRRRAQAFTITLTGSSQGFQSLQSLRCMILATFTNLTGASETETPSNFEGVIDSLERAGLNGNPKIWKCTREHPKSVRSVLAIS